jgi:hypothetical protein
MTAAILDGKGTKMAFADRLLGGGLPWRFTSALWARARRRRGAPAADDFQSRFDERKESAAAQAIEELNGSAGKLAFPVADTRGDCQATTVAVWKPFRAPKPIARRIVNAILIKLYRMQSTCQSIGTIALVYSSQRILCRLNKGYRSAEHRLGPAGYAQKLISDLQLAAFYHVCVGNACIDALRR